MYRINPEGVSLQELQKSRSHTKGYCVPLIHSIFTCVTTTTIMRTDRAYPCERTNVSRPAVLPSNVSDKRPEGSQRRFHES